MSASLMAGGNSHNPHFAETTKHDDRRILIGIVGQGAGGAAVLAELTRLAIRDGITDAVSFLCIDTKPVKEHGRGVAWGSDVSAELLANMQVDKIGTGELTTSLVPSSRSLDNVWPSRVDVGTNLASQHIDQVKSARHAGICITQIQGEVATTRRSGAGYALRLSSGEEFFVHVAILALGTMPPTTYAELNSASGYVGNPWESGALDRIPDGADERVAVLGLGPTAVDTIIMLRKKGVKNIHAFSRTGTMQYPRPNYRSRPAQVLTPEYVRSRAALHKDGLTVRDIVSMLADEFRAQKVDCGPLQKMLANSKLSPEQAIPLGLAECEAPNEAFAVFKTLDAVTPLLWHLMQDGERELYWRTLRHEHTNLGYAASTRQARRVLDFLHDGTLLIYSDVHDVALVNGRVSITGRRHEMNYSYAYKYVVNCTGVGSDLSKVRYPLVGDLLAEGLMFPHKFGGAIVDFDSGQLLNQNGGATGSIYSLVGSMTYGTHLLTHCLAETGKSALRTAGSVHDKIMRLLSRPVAA